MNRTDSTHFTITDAPSVSELTRCVQCGLCLSACPTFLATRNETASPRGRLYLMRALGEGRIEPTATFQHHMDLCLQCRACETACPSGVRFGHLMEATRAELRAHRGGLFADRALRWLTFRHLLPSSRRLALLGTMLRAYQRSGLSRLVCRILRGRLAVAETLLPPLSTEFFEPCEVPAATGDDGDVALFAGCVMRIAFAETHRATLRLVEQAGLTAVAPADQVCCGALHLHAGERTLARALARRNIQAFERAGEATILVNAAGCGAALKQYGELLARDDRYVERARRFSSRVRDASELLLEHLPQPAAQPPSLRVTYQEACHLAHAQRIREQPRAVLRSLPGVELVEMADADLCCGSAGLYNLTQPTMSEQLLQRKVAAIAATGAQVVVSTNPGCLIQLRSGLERSGLEVRALHLVDLVDELSSPARSTSSTQPPT